MSNFGKISKIKFLDKVENDWASEKNPHRFGYFIKKGRGTLHLTDGRGDYWEVYNDSKSRLRIVGSYMEDQIAKLKEPIE